MATEQEKNDYINLLRQELVFYGDKTAVRTQHGHMPLVQKQNKFMLLQAYLEIAERFLDEYEVP